MVLTLSNEKIGKPSVPQTWDRNLRAYVPDNYKENFIRSLNRSVAQPGPKASYEAIKNSIDRLKYHCDTIDDKAEHYHQNFMIYLEKCWADHLGIVITPDIIWYTLLSEVTILVKKNPEEYRKLFTHSDKKEDIIVLSGDPVVMPLSSLSDALKDRVPTDTDVFFPKFSTRTPRSFHAFQAAFCDMCSPYYNYGMLLCNIPMIDVRGTLDDWKILLDKWIKLVGLIGESDWTNRVGNILTTIVLENNNGAFWKAIFSVQRCGSGHQTQVSGWFANLFQEQPKVRYAENYSPHIAMVKYKQLNFNQNFEMYVGLFGSSLEGEFMVPDFSFVVNEVLDH